MRLAISEKVQVVCLSLLRWQAHLAYSRLLTAYAAGANRALVEYVVID